MRFILSSFYVVSPFCCFFVCRTGEAALGYGEVAEECLRRYWPKRAYVGRCGNNFTIFSPTIPPPPNSPPKTTQIPSNRLRHSQQQQRQHGQVIRKLSISSDHWINLLQWLQPPWQALGSSGRRREGAQEREWFSFSFILRDRGKV